MYPSIFIQFSFFLLIYDFLLPPYFDNDAFMHHALHVLDAPESTSSLTTTVGLLWCHVVALIIIIKIQTNTTFQMHLLYCSW